MTPESALLALFLGALTWYGRRSTADRLGGPPRQRRSVPLAKLASSPADQPPTPTDGSAATRASTARGGPVEATEVSQPPAAPQPPAIPGVIVDEAPTPDTPTEEIDAVVRPTPPAPIRTVAPATDPILPSEPVAAQTMLIPAVTAEQKHDSSGRPETAAAAPEPTPLTPTDQANVDDGEPHGCGSARSLPDGSPPGPDYPIKGNANSMLFHPPTSPYYKQTKAEVWFRTADDARAAGFIEWTPRKRTTH